VSREHFDLHFASRPLIYNLNIPDNAVRRIRQVAELVLRNEADFSLGRKTERLP